MNRLPRVMLSIVKIQNRKKNKIGNKDKERTTLNQQQLCIDAFNLKGSTPLAPISLWFQVTEGGKKQTVPP